MKKYTRALILKEFLPIYESRYSDVVKINLPLMDLRNYEPKVRFLYLVKKYRDKEIFKAYFTRYGKIKYYLIDKNDKVKLV